MATRQSVVAEDFTTRHVRVANAVDHDSGNISVALRGLKCAAVDAVVAFVLLVKVHSVRHAKEHLAERFLTHARPQRSLAMSTTDFGAPALTLRITAASIIG